MANKMPAPPFQKHGTAIQCSDTECFSLLVVSQNKNDLVISRGVTEHTTTLSFFECGDQQTHTRGVTDQGQQDACSASKKTWNSRLAQ
jgi:hypothetical protein